MFAKIKTLLSRQDSFLRNVAVLSSASVVAQVINVLTMPVFSRLYSPSDFGTLSLFTSVVGLLATVSGFRYYLVIPLARTDRYLHSLIWTSFIFQSICVVLIVIMVEVASRFMAGTAYAVLIPYRFLIPLGVLCVGTYSLLTQWAIRTKEFSLIAKTKLTQTFARAAVTLICGLTGIKPLGLLLGNILGQSFGSTSLLYKLISGSKKIQFSHTHIARASIYYRKMLYYDTPGALLNMSGAYLLPIIMAYFFNHSVVGSFSMAQNVLVLPSVLIGTSIGQVFRQKASEAFYHGSVAQISLKSVSALMRIGCFPVLAIAFIAPELFSAVLGPEWRQAGVFALILGPWIALNFVYGPLSSLYTIIMLQKMGFVFVAFYTATRLLSAYIGKGNPLLAVTLISITGSLMMVVGIYLLLWKSGVKKIKTIKTLLIIFVEILIEICPFIMILVLFGFKTCILYKLIAVGWGGLVYISILYKKLLK
jgi:O-antigen/teichoic acid export membrane protein